MTFNPERHHRRSIRLRDYDYSWAGWYYVTICTKDGECALGTINADVVRLSKMGEIAQTHWQGIPSHFPSVELDDFVIMPNHLHGIIILNDQPRRGEVISPRLGIATSPPSGDETSPRVDNRLSPLSGDATSPLRDVTLGRVVAYFKYQSTKAINQELGIPAAKFWQRNYFEHIIRNDADLSRIRTYIRNNPPKWALDEKNANRVP